jgi:capsular exopolysaccharide synthesis family protein
VDLLTYTRILRRRWRVVVAVALLTVSVAALTSLLSPRKYQSTAEFFVSTSDPTGTNLASGGAFTQQRVKSYVQLLKTPRVLEPAIKSAGLDLTPAQLAGRISGSVPPDSVLIDVNATDDTPAGAQKIAKAVADTFPTVVSELETLGTEKSSPVKVTVVKEAQIQASPVSPRPVRSIVLGTALGILLGLGAAVLADLLDKKVRTKEDVEELTDATVLGGIPFDSDASKHPLIIQSDPHVGRAEAFRAVRTNLQFVDAATHPRVLLLTSSIAGEGKTTTAANLALVLAQSGAKVCVIEGDLRRPRLLSYMGMAGSVGLTDVLIDRFELDDVLQPFGALSLDVLGAGAAPPNPSELLGSQRMRELIAHLKTRFDFVLIDGAPLLPVADSAVLSALVDGTILVVGCGVVAKDQVDSALENVATVNGNLLGVILNRLPRRGHGGAYDYRYEYRSDSAATVRGRGRLRRPARSEEAALTSVPAERS